MPRFVIEVTEVVHHRFLIEAPDQQTAEQVEDEALADACAEGTHCTHVSDRTVTRTYPIGSEELVGERPVFQMVYVEGELETVVSI